MNGLLLHCGAKPATREEIIDSDSLRPAPTRTHFPIPHHTVVEHLETTIDRMGFKPRRTEFGLTPDGQRMFGLMEVDDGVPRDDYSLLVGMRNAHDKSDKAKYAMGNRVFVCDNYAFTGMVEVARKHTRHILRDLPKKVAEVVQKLSDMRGLQDRRIATYKESELTDQQAHDLLVQSIDVGAIGCTRLKPVLEEWRTPTYEDFKPRTAWSLFNAYTEVLKGSGLGVVQRSTPQLYGLFDGYLGLALDSQN